LRGGSLDGRDTGPDPPWPASREQWLEGRSQEQEQDRVSWAISSFLFSPAGWSAPSHVQCVSLLHDPLPSCTWAARRLRCTFIFALCRRTGRSLAGSLAPSTRLLLHGVGCVKLPQQRRVRRPTARLRARRRGRPSDAGSRRTARQEGHCPTAGACGHVSLRAKGADARL
jgi:hypothetical protein